MRRITSFLRYLKPFILSFKTKKEAITDFCASMKETTLLPESKYLAEMTFKCEKRELVIVQLNEINANEYSTKIKAERS